MIDRLASHIKSDRSSVNSDRVGCTPLGCALDGAAGADTMTVDGLLPTVAMLLIHGADPNQHAAFHPSYRDLPDGSSAESESRADVPLLHHLVAATAVIRHDPLLVLVDTSECLDEEAEKAAEEAEKAAEEAETVACMGAKLLLFAGCRDEA